MLWLWVCLTTKGRAGPGEDTDIVRAGSVGRLVSLSLSLANRRSLSLSLSLANRRPANRNPPLSAVTAALSSHAARCWTGLISKESMDGPQRPATPHGRCARPESPPRYRPGPAGYAQRAHRWSKSAAGQTGGGTRAHRDPSGRRGSGRQAAEEAARRAAEERAPLSQNAGRVELEGSWAQPAVPR